jgi:hypothetical protein
MTNTNNKSTIQTLRVATVVLAAYMQVWAARLAKPVVPGTTNCLLSDPDKMPGKSYGLPAHLSCPREFGTICKNCYASKGCYCWKGPKAAQMARFKWTIECMRTDAGMDLWVATMVQALVKETYFRIHDSGDFFNVRYAMAWLRVCKALPATKFWAPTRAWQGGKSGLLPVFDPLMNVLRQMAALPNVTLRPSALDFGDLPPVVPGLHAGSTADNSSDSVYQCPAKALYDGHCGPCRHCWDNKSESVNYPKH